MDTYAIHMAMAALAGASVAAFSSYYLHRQALAQFLEFALTVERHRVGGETDSSPGAGAIQLNRSKGKQWRRSPNHVRRRRPAAEKIAAMAEETNGLVEEKDGHVARKEKGLSRMESLPGEMKDLDEFGRPLRLQEGDPMSMQVLKVVLPARFHLRK